MLLNEACLYGPAQSVQYLLDKVIDVNRDADDFTPLMVILNQEKFCQFRDDSELLMKRLFAAGADVNAKHYESGHTLIMSTEFEFGLPERMWFLIKYADLNS